MVLPTLSNQRTDRSAPSTFRIEKGGYDKWQQPHFAGGEHKTVVLDSMCSYEFHYYPVGQRAANKVKIYYKDTQDLQDKIKDFYDAEGLRVLRERELRDTIYKKAEDTAQQEPAPQVNESQDGFVNSQEIYYDSVGEKLEDDSEEIPDEEDTTQG